MAKKSEVNRERIINAANKLFYEKGFNQTAFSEVAEASGIPKGNFYYYFKSKDELLDAVIAMREKSIQSLLENWEVEYTNPHDRLKRYVKILINEASEVVQYGCPLGTLNSELAKSQRNLQSRAHSMFELFNHWLIRQFRALGKGRESAHLAMHLLSMTQGAALIANIYRDKPFISREVKRINDWIDSL